MTAPSQLRSYNESREYANVKNSDKHEMNYLAKLKGKISKGQDGSSTRGPEQPPVQNFSE